MSKEAVVGIFLGFGGVGVNIVWPDFAPLGWGLMILGFGGGLAWALWGDIPASRTRAIKAFIEFKIKQAKKRKPETFYYKKWQEQCFDGIRIAIKQDLWMKFVQKFNSHLIAVLAYGANGPDDYEKTLDYFLNEDYKLLDEYKREIKHQWLEDGFVPADLDEYKEYPNYVNR